MKAKDKIKKQRVGDSVLPNLHGHVKITLTDQKTGKTEVRESDNTVTWALRDIFSKNNFGAKDYTQLSPLRDMLGGVICFEDEFDSTTAEMVADNVNKMTAHAGQTPHATNNPYRGNPNAMSGEVQDGKGYRFIWDFSTNQGNGTISTVCLTHKDMGDIGLKPIEIMTGKALFMDNTNKTKTYLTANSPDTTFDKMLHCALSVWDGDEPNEGLHAYLPNTSGNTKLILTEFECDFASQGINRTVGECTATNTTEVTLTRAFRATNSAVTMDVEGNIYVVSAGTSNGHTLYINKIDKDDYTNVTEIVITEQSMNLGYKSMAYNESDDNLTSACCINWTCISDGYIYWTDDTFKNFYKINLTNTADIVHLTSNLTENANVNRLGMYEVSSGLIFGANFIINNDVVYPSYWGQENVKSVTSGESSYYQYSVIRFIACESGDYEWSYVYNTYYDYRFRLCSGFPLGYLATNYTLESPVVKTSDKTMQIEYTITLDES